MNGGLPPEASAPIIAPRCRGCAPRRAKRGRNEALAEPQRPLWLLAVLLTAWVFAFGWSGIVAASARQTQDGFNSGLSRLELFLGWQAVAGLIALAAFAVGRGWPKGSGIRRVSAVPFWLALALLAAVASWSGWARFSA